jgi:hypothetical protein
MMLSSSWTALFVCGVLLGFGFCAQKEYTVNIGTQATIIGYEYDSPPGRLFAGIPYAQPMTNTNRFMVCLLLRNLRHFMKCSYNREEDDQSQAFLLNSAAYESIVL